MANTNPSGSRLSSSSRQQQSINNIRGYDTGNLGISRLNSPSDYLHSLQLSAFIFACVNIRASSFAKLGLRALDPDGQEVFGPQPRGSAAAKPRKHPLYRLLQKPNQVQSYYDFFYTIQMYTDVLGNCLVLMDDIDPTTKLPGSLWPLDPSRSSVVLEDDLKGYGFRDANNIDNFLPLERVLHFKRPNTLTPYWGTGIVQMLAKEINIHAALTEYISQYFNQGAQPSGILTSKMALSDEVFDRLKMEAQANLAGSMNAHRLPVFDSGIEYKALSANLKELGAEDLDKLLMKKILTAFEVPGTKFGLLEFASYKAEDMEKSFVESMESIARLHEGPLNKLAGMFDKKGRAVPPDEMKAAQTGRVFMGDIKGLSSEFVLPRPENIATLVKTAADLAMNPVLSAEERRNGVLQLLGALLVAPSGFEGVPIPPSAEIPVPVTRTLNESD